MPVRRHHTDILIAALALVGVTGCGRFGFGDDAPIDAAPDVMPDTPVAIEPMELAITQTFVTAQTTFVDIPAATLTLPASPGTSWLVLTSAKLASPTFSAQSVEARYLLDDVELGMGGTQTSTPGFPGPWQHFVVIAGTTAPQQLRYQLRDVSAAGAILEALTVEAIPFAAADVAYASNDPVHDVTAVAATADSVLSLGPLSGDYVFFLVANTTDLPGESDCYVQWMGPNGATWMRDSQQPRESWQSFMTVQRGSFDIVAAHVTLLTHVGSGPCQVRNVRAAAIPTSAFASVDYARNDDATLVNATATPATTVTLTPMPSSATQFLFWGNAMLDEDCLTVADAQRTVVFTHGSTTESISHATDNCSYTATYGHVALLPSAPSSMSIGFSSGSGAGGVDHYASELMLLGLR
ncbi:MAG TPA: hypothetical protein VMZ53_19150 [Kofleriaceae bacterium]|nr:hypothetical protein [Kofleriaceae bacterium]